MSEKEAEMRRLDQLYADVKEGLARIPKKMRYGYDSVIGEFICQGYDGIQDPGSWEPETRIEADGHLWEVGLANAPCVRCDMKYQTYLDQMAYLLCYPNRLDLREQIHCHGGKSKLELVICPKGPRCTNTLCNHAKPHTVMGDCDKMPAPLCDNVKPCVPYKPEPSVKKAIVVIECEIPQAVANGPEKTREYLDLRFEERREGIAQSRIKLWEYLEQWPK